MSPQSSKRSGGGSPRLDVYVALLFVAVGSLLTGCIFLWLELNKYGWQLAQ